MFPLQPSTSTACFENIFFGTSRLSKHVLHEHVLQSAPLESKIHVLACELWRIFDSKRAFVRGAIVADNDFWCIKKGSTTHLFYESFKLQKICCECNVRRVLTNPKLAQHNMCVIPCCYKRVRIDFACQTIIMQ